MARKGMLKRSVETYGVLRYTDFPSKSDKLNKTICEFRRTETTDYQPWYIPASGFGFDDQ